MSPPIPYDEMRRLCGLPDVRGYVARRELTSAFQKLGKSAAASCEPFLQLVRSLKASQAPPMWANNPARTRRTAYKPTRRVK